MKNELENFLIGSKLGFGIHRDVFKYSLDQSLVVKIANSPEGRQANILEFFIYDELKETEFKKWFAPCIEVSEGGKYLIQKKIEFGRVKNYPTKIPAFFTDLKEDNYGWIGKQFVCCDYAGTVLTRCISRKMKNHKWFNCSIIFNNSV